MTQKHLFRTFLIGGFECSTHRTRSGERLDLISSTGHDAHAMADYARLRERGIQTARDGIRWHLIEQTPGRYNFSSVLSQLRAAQRQGVQVIWDLCHYGWPDDIDIFSTEFVRRFARVARAFVAWLVDQTGETPFVCPMNEISFFSWAGAEVGYFNPAATGRGNELKAQLVRATIEAIEAIWEVAPEARIIHTDPLINVVADPERPEDRHAAQAYNRAQFDSWDMLAGRTSALSPSLNLGGHEKYLDILGLNYYPHNQWVYSGQPSNPAEVIDPSAPLYRPLRQMLGGVYQRYRRPIFISETGAIGEERPAWLRYIGREVRAARKAGVPIEGLCLYPIVNYPTWEGCHDVQSGLWDYADERGKRDICLPLLHELQRQRRHFEHVTHNSH